MKNELLIASAGAGKTTCFVKEALKCQGSVLLTTFTEENALEIKKKVIELNNGAIPSNLTIQTWFSFLIEHGAKPYQGNLTDKKINGLILVNQKSALRIKKINVDKYYFSKDYQIYSDKLSEFVIQCDNLSKGYVIRRISALFSNIFIDEVQDLAGYDLEFIKRLLNSESSVKMTGDPRQVTYHTHFSKKYQKYRDGKIQEFIATECKDSECFIDTDTLKDSWRNNQLICDFANKIFPEHPPCKSKQPSKTDHDGIFLIREKDVENYLKKHSPLQLRYNRQTKKVNTNYEVKNFGESKGTTYERVLIYPTKKMEDWILKDIELSSFEVKCKFYVAVTRAKFSVGIVCKNNIITNHLPIYQFN